MQQKLLIKFMVWSLAVFAGGALWANNLIPGDTGFDDEARRWFPYRQEDTTVNSIVPDKGIKNSSAACLSAKNVTPLAAWYRMGHIAAKAGQVYTLDVQVKTRLRQGYLFSRANFWSDLEGPRQVKESKMTGMSASGKISGSTDGKWVTLRHSFKVPEGANGIHIQLWAREFCGEVLFDNVSLAEGIPPLNIPEISALPEIDGVPDASFMEQALECAPFLEFPAIGTRLAKEKTAVWIARAPEHIILAGQCVYDPEREFKADLVNPDSNLWEDDSVECFITHCNQATPFYQFIINSNGALYDALESNRNWSSQALKAAKKQHGLWTFELAIPLTSIGYNPMVDTHVSKLDWKINFGRNHWGGQRAVYSTWARVATSFGDIDNFVEISNQGGYVARTAGLQYFTREGQIHIDQRPKHWKIDDPLYQELLSGEKKSLHGEAAMIWPRPVDMAGNRLFALQYGQVYNILDIYADYTRYNLRPFSKIQRWEPSLGPNLPLMKQLKTGLLLHFPNNYRMTFDPAMVEERFSWAEKFIQENRDILWGICVGDETMYQSLKTFLPIANDPERVANDKLLAQALDDIKNRYGYGKYGVPSSLTAANEPFQWLAMRRWYFDRQTRWVKKLYEWAKSEKCKDGKAPLIISSDCINGLYFQHQSRQSPFFDIATGQSLPGNSEYRQRIAYDTKLLKDLTGKDEVWPCAHTEPYPGIYNIEETTAFLSEVARGGGTGLHIWNYDYLGDMAGMNGTRFDYYGHKARWDARLECVEQFRHMGRLKFPAPDYAIFLSEDHANTHYRMSVPDYEALFNMMGPVARTWFKFITDIQVLDNQEKLSSWKTIFVPRAMIQRKEVSGLFPEYVQGGGTLVCLDAELFSWHADGSETSYIREQLFGVRTGEIAKASQIKLDASALWPGCNIAMPLPVAGACRKLLAGKDVSILARFDTGDPAITLKNYASGGRAILFAFNMEQSCVSQELWRNFFKSLAKGLGIQTEQDIWRFRFPFKESRPPARKPADPLCLTGNHLEWWMNKVFTVHNAALSNGSYRYSLTPDAPAEQHVTDGAFSFAQGDLTDRPGAPEAGDVANARKNKARLDSGELSLEQFIVGWSKPDALSITFDLGTECTVEKVRVIYSGELPGYAVACGLEDRNLTIRAAIAGLPASDDVPGPEVTFSPVKARYVRIDIPQRSNGGRLLISEVEIWGQAGGKR